jgi:hypothetical protein
LKWQLLNSFLDAILGTGLNNIFSHLSFDPEIQDGVKIQNGAQKRKNLIFAAKWPIFNEFQKTISLFVCPT